MTHETSEPLILANIRRTKLRAAGQTEEASEQLRNALGLETLVLQLFGGGLGFRDFSRCKEVRGSGGLCLFLASRGSDRGKAVSPET